VTCYIYQYANTATSSRYCFIVIQC